MVMGMDTALIAATLVIACCAAVASLRVIAERVEFAQRVARLRMQTERLRSSRRERRS